MFLGQCKQYQKENNQEALSSNDGASGKRDPEGFLQTGTRARCPEPEQQFSLLQAAATSSQSYQRTPAPSSQRSQCLQSPQGMHTSNAQRQAGSKPRSWWDILHPRLPLVPVSLAARPPAPSSAGEPSHFGARSAAGSQPQSLLAAYAHCCPVSPSQSFQLLPSLPSFFAAPSIPKHHSFQKQTSLKSPFLFPFSLLSSLFPCSLDVTGGKPVQAKKE